MRSDVIRSLFFFFSSRRRHTRSLCDWSSDVCSSDLLCLSNPKSTGTKLFSVCGNVQRPGNYEVTLGFPLKDVIYDMCGGPPAGRTLKARSEERRVGKEGSWGWAPYQ